MFFDCLARVSLLAAETAFAFEEMPARRMAWGDRLFKSRVSGNSNVKVNGIGSNAADGSANALALTSEYANLLPSARSILGTSSGRRSW